VSLWLIDNPSVAINVNARLLGDLFCLDIDTEENPNGAHRPSELYKHLLDVRILAFNNNDPGLAWNRRRFAQEAATALSESTQNLVSKVNAERLPKTFLNTLRSILPSEANNEHNPKHGSLRWYGRNVASELLAAGKTVEEVSDIMWPTALAGVGAPVAVVCVMEVPHASDSS
jgi:hypothetical protein